MLLVLGNSHSTPDAVYIVSLEMVLSYPWVISLNQTAQPWVPTHPPLSLHPGLSAITPKLQSGTT